MSWVAWIVVGFLAGVLAKAVTGVKRPGCLMTIVVGIVGGVVGGWLFEAFGNEGVDGLTLRSVLVAFVGACVLLVVWSLLTGDRSRRRGR